MGAPEPRAPDRRRTPGRRREDRATQFAFEEAFIALTDGVVITDASGSILSANPAAFRLLEEAALVGHRFDDLLYVSGATTVQEQENHVVRRAWFPREDRMGVLEIVSTPIGLGPSGTIHTVRDVTAQAELLRLKEDFLLQVAHELRTPIAAMVASLDLVHQDALTMSREELTRMVDTLGRSAHRLEFLVENLLDAGSIEAGTFQIRLAPTSLSACLEESLSLVRSFADTKRQRIEKELDGSADHVLADQRRTSQVFANVIGNASKYSPEGTTIRIASAVEDGFVRVTVADQGPGIPEDERPRLFQRFFRSREVREAAGGLGLGLTICRAIVQAQGGDIAIESEVGRGTSVHFTIPKARELAEEA
ncbi:MAG TPA: HAMP domain-containing sensor histidine kinase [Candidatus Limnocylindria bacterium]|nr:HAMP domain-containing sensor histidine kinase [Candidatus Limnocylindria bacterium]